MTALKDRSPKASVRPPKNKVGRASLQNAKISVKEDFQAKATPVFNSYSKRTWEFVPAAIGSFLGAAMAGISLLPSLGLATVAAIGYAALQRYAIDHLKR